MLYQQPFYCHTGLFLTQLTRNTISSESIGVMLIKKLPYIILSRIHIFFKSIKYLFEII
jgi:hypothetical protein